MTLPNRLVLMENSVPTIRGPPGSDCSATERAALEGIEAKASKQAARTASMFTGPKTAAEYVREAAGKTVRNVDLGSGVKFPSNC